MRTIWKYELPHPESTLMLPAGGVVRHFGAQGDALCVWVEVETTAQSEPRPFICVNTGGLVPADEDGVRAEYRGCATVRGIVWHLYEGLRGDG